MDEDKISLNIVITSRVINNEGYIQMKKIAILTVLVAIVCSIPWLSTQPRAAIDYPVRLTYVNKMDNWWPPEKIAASLGVPGYAAPSQYNHIVLTFWTCDKGAIDAASVWADPLKFFGSDNPFGNSKDDVQKFLKNKYNSNGKKVLVSAFGSTQFPTSQGVDPVKCATDLGVFVGTNNLDGVDINWEDTEAFNDGIGQSWLISFTKKLRQFLPNHIISHAPQAPYFASENYKGGAYITVDKQAGSSIDFYNIQFYNQGDTTYDTFERLFLESDGYFRKTSVKQINQRGIPLSKIVVGKPVTPKDASNTGWMEKGQLGDAVTRGKQQLGWSAGVFFWQYSSDLTGETIAAVISGLLSEEHTS